MEHSLEMIARVCDSMKGSLKYLALITQVGLSIIITLSIFTVFGVYLDRFLNTNAVFTLLFVLFGCFAALWTAYTLITKSLAKNSEKE